MARYVRVSSISLGGVPRGEDRPRRAREAAVALLEQAALDRPDIVCLPECFTGLDAEAAETVPGPTVEALGEVARRHGMYVVCPIARRQDGRIYNAAVLLDRRGEPVGAYHKIHPTLGELELGVTPGTEATVLETDFGRVGFAICYDLNFRDVIEGAAAGGAEIVFFPSMYRGGLQLQVWAHDFGVFIVSAYGGEGSAIVDPLGRVLLQSQTHQRIISRVLNLDRLLCHIDFNQQQWLALKQKYGDGVEIDVATPEAIFALVSHLPDVSATDIAREFELETRRDYFRRADRAREAALRGQPLLITD